MTRLLRVLVAAATAAQMYSAGSARAATDGRPANWAEPLEKPGLPNLHKVGPALYRGGQPDKDGYAQLKAMGVKTVVCLRKEKDSPGEERLVDEQGLKFVRIGTDAARWRHEDTVKLLKILADADARPVYVHCRRGTDRTGIMCAASRVVLDGWSKGDALKEMTKLTTWTYAWTGEFPGLIDYLRGLDVEAVRKEIGLDAKGAGGTATNDREAAAGTK